MIFTGTILGAEKFTDKNFDIENFTGRNLGADISTVKILVPSFILVVFLAELRAEISTKRNLKAEISA